MTTARRVETLARLRPYIERARTFSGWNFDELDVRPLDPPPPWDYADMAREYAQRAARVLDCGTGGGEVLARIIGEPRRGVVATEEWHVNVPVARDRLRPLGAGVVHASTERLPFRDGAFDLVLSRHEAIEPAEVVRVLGGAGVFLTQQVWEREWKELGQFFPRRTEWGDHLTECSDAFRRAGYAVTIREHDWRAAYGGLGEIVFMLLVAPWEVPDFDPEADIDALIALEDALTTSEGLVMTLSRYLMIAERPS